MSDQFEDNVAAIRSVVDKTMIYDEMYVDKQPRNRSTGIRCAVIKFAAFKTHNREQLENDIEAIEMMLSEAGIAYEQIKGDIAVSTLYNNKYNAVYIRVIVDKV